MSNEEWKDGLPGVGVVCEFPTNGGDYDTCEVKGVNGVDAWIYNEAIGHKVVRVNILHPIKKREPEPGEVWNLPAYGFAAIYCMDGAFRSFEGGAERTNTSDATYAAPDVKSYIARELLKGISGGTSGSMPYDLHADAINAARLDEV